MKFIDKTFRVYHGAIPLATETTMRTIRTGPANTLFIQSIDFADYFWTAKNAWRLPGPVYTFYDRLFIKRNGQKIFEMQGHTTFHPFKIKLEVDSGEISFVAYHNNPRITNGFFILGVVAYEMVKEK